MPFYKIRKQIRFWMLLLLATLLIIACQKFPSKSPTAPSNSMADCRVVKHEMGETEICGQPSRVAALSPHILDSMLSLGVQPIAYADGSRSFNLQKFDQPEAQIPYIGRYVTTQPINLGDRKNPSLERLAKVKPDLILSEDWLAEEHYSLLSKIAPTLLFSDVDDEEGDQHWHHDIEGIAQALGKEAEVKALLTQHSNQIAAMRKQLAPVAAAYPRVLVISSDNPTSSIYLGDSTTPRLLHAIGFETVSPKNSPLISGGDSQISMEALPQIEADLIFVMAWSDEGLRDPQEKVKQQWAENPLLNQMSAFKAGHVFFVDYYIWGSVTRGPITDQLVLDQLPQILLPLVDDA